MKQRLSTSLLLGVVLTVSVLAGIALAAGSNGVALAYDDVDSPSLEVGDISTVPTEPLLEPAEPIVVTGFYTDPTGLAPSYTALLDWGDGSSSECTSGSVPIPISTSDPDSCSIDASLSLVQATHAFTDPGVFTVLLSVTPDGEEDRKGESTLFVVVYDPDGGFVTGGGWINSPQGACQLTDSCKDVSGKATFGFVSKYKKGADAPTGNTQFQFKAGDLNFHSGSYEWLVVNQGGTNAQYKGKGAINGEGAPNGEAYKFMLRATDDGSDPGDTFRIKIWWEEGDTEHVVYDNGSDQPISGGSIVIHKGKGK